MVMFKTDTLNISLSISSYDLKKIDMHAVGWSAF